MHAKKIIVVTAVSLALTGSGVFAADITMNPYTDEGNTLTIGNKSTLEGAGEVKSILLKTEPKVVLQKWNGEVALGVEFTDIKASTTGSRQILSDKVNWDEGDKKLTVFPLERSSSMEDGGVELLIELQNKPANNVFNFQLDNWENLDFFLQEPLWKVAGLSGPEKGCTETDCVINKDESHRPENIVNSYAVYYKNHQDYHLGHTNYATGKAFHIFRPLITDLNGVSVWGDLKYEKGVLSITVPQKFLDTASYPVSIDPTFGYDTKGLTTATIGGARSYIGSPYTAVAGDVVVGYGGYVCNSSAATAGITAYTFSGGIAVTRLGSANSLTGITACGVQLRTVSGLSDPLTPGVQYVPAMGNPNGATVQIAFDTTSGNQLDRQGTDFTLGTTWTHVDYSSAKLSMFAYYYTATCSGTCTETFTTTGNFVGPSGVVSANVACWGGGGGGNGAGASNDGGAGGGGGAYSAGTFSITTGTLYTVTVGAGGAAGVTGVSNGGDGSDSWFSSTGTLLAKAGLGLSSGSTGGAAASGVGTVKTSGGNGGAGPGVPNLGGSGGGGSGGDTTSGSNGTVGGLTTGGAGGTAGTTNGATGGAGGNQNIAGSQGISPGSGGGGGGATTNRNGGAGAGGKCVITYRSSGFSPWQFQDF